MSKRKRHFQHFFPLQCSTPLRLASLRAAVMFILLAPLLMPVLPLATFPSRLPRITSLWAALLLLVPCTRAAETNVNDVAASAASNSASSATNGPVIQVGADSSLKLFLQDASQLFADEHNEIKIQINLAPSGTLRERIEQHTFPLDVFIAAAPGEIETLADQGFLRADTVRYFAQNAIMVATCWPTKKGDVWTSLARLSWENVGIASEVKCMSGVAARAAFKELELEESLAGRITVYNDSNLLLKDLKLARIPAAVVYRSDVVQLVPRETFSVFAVGATNLPQIAYSGVILNASKLAVPAQAFLDFLASEELIPLWEKHGFYPAKFGRKPLAQNQDPAVKASRSTNFFYPANKAEDEGTPQFPEKKLIMPAASDVPWPQAPKPAHKYGLSATPEPTSGNASNMPPAKAETAPPKE